MPDENELNDEQLLNKELGVDEEVDIVEEEQAAESTEAELAEKALESSDEPAENAEAEDQIPLSKYMGVKTKARDLEVENARLQGELAGIEKATVKTVKTEQELSPVQREMAAQEVDSEDELDLTGAEAMKLMRQEQAFEKKQDDLKAAETTTQTTQQTQAESYRAAIDNHDVQGLDFKTIVTEGEKLLTKGEGVDINEMTDGFGEAVYVKCLNAIIRKGGDRAKELQELLAAQKSETKTEEEEPEKKTVTKKKVKKKTSRNEDDLDEELLASEEESGDDELDTPSSRITNFMFG